MSDLKEIDLGLSRQLQIFEKPSIIDAPHGILLYGCNTSLIAEIAKNLTLCRAGMVIIVDNGCKVPKDYETVPFLHADVQDNQTFACAVVKYCKEACHDAQIQTIAQVEVPDLLQSGKVQVAVFANQTVPILRTYNDECRKNGIKFIAVSSNGIACSIFNDFLEEHSYADRNGTYAEDECIKEIKEIVFHSGGARVTLNQQNKLNHIRKGDSVYLTTSSVGSNITRNCPKCEVVLVDKDQSSIQIQLEDAGDNFDIKRAKYVKKIPRNIKMSFRSLQEFSADPTLQCQDDFSALANLVYIVKLNDEPVANNVEEWITKTRLLHHQMTLEAKIEVKFDENIVRKIILSWDSALPPIVSFVSALATNEVMKACSGRYKPIHQLACFSSPLILGPTYNPSPVLLSDNSPNRLQRSIIGEAANERLKNLKILLVGAGALGCELAKLFVAMGIGTGPHGHIHVVDFDRIEPSNLHRQFWFTTNDRGLFKSEVLVRECKKINAKINCTAYTHKLDKNSVVLGDEFFENLDVIVGAVDSFEAREYLCKLAQTYDKLFLEAGTGAMVGSSSFFIKGKTDVYTSPSKEPARLAASCTAKSYPKQFIHCIQWATMRFHETFFEQLSVYMHHLKNPSKTHSNHASMIAAFSTFFQDHNPNALLQFFFDSWFTTKMTDLPVKQPAVGVFNLANELHQQFVNKFCSVLAERPLDDLATQFDKDNLLHLELISVAARIYAEIFNTDTISDSIEDLYRVQIMAANITPAIITTTAAMASLCALQLYKFVADLPVSTYDIFDCNFAANYIGVVQMDDSATPLENSYLELDPIAGSMTVKEFAQLFQNHLEPNEEITEIEIRTSRGLRWFDPNENQRIGELFDCEPQKFKFILATISVTIGGQNVQLRVKATLLRDKPSKRWFFF